MEVLTRALPEEDLSTEWEAECSRRWRCLFGCEIESGMHFH